MTASFETEPCKRCGGTGHHSFNYTHGDRCFGCNGTGNRITKRGAAASAWMRDRLAMDYTQVQVGQRIKFRTQVGLQIHHIDCYVASVEISERKSPLKSEPGMRKRVTVTTPAGREYVLSGDWNHVRRCPTQAEFDEALAYQNSLTKAGKPRSRKVAA